MKTRVAIPAIALAIAILMMLIPATAQGQTTAVEPIYKAVQNAGVHVDDLRVIPVEGVIIVRGRVHDQQSLHRVTMLLKDLGYLRVCNMLKIVPAPNDQEIRRRAERELGINRSMDGARLRVHSENGIVTIQGKVRYELQRDAAINIVRGIDGVRDVRYNFEKM